jgi:nucleotide-binding universal stress UspA family protein
MIRINQILCPIDFSAFSRHAFDRAVGLARGYGATVAVLHVLPVPSAVPAVPFGPEGPGPFGFQIVDQERALKEIPRFLAVESGVDVPITYHVTESPSVQKEIVLQARMLSADVVVLGSHGRSGFDRLMLGSVAEKVLRSCPTPVMTVPSHAPDVVPITRDPFRRILYATDFSSGADAALPYAASFAQHAAAQLIFMHVVEPIPIGYDPVAGVSFDVAAYHAELEKNARAKLRTVVPESIRLGCDTEDVVTTGKPYVEILRAADERLIDLIVIGVHGRNALDRLVFGSTTEHLVRRATCPVLTVREG